MLEYTQQTGTAPNSMYPKQSVTAPESLNGSINTYNNSYCPYRLPCGLCMKLEYDCPKLRPHQTDITYSTSKGCSVS